MYSSGTQNGVICSSIVNTCYYCYYLTDSLSPSGGNFRSLTLSQGNLESFIKETPLAALTQTFRDAIEVA
jgi:hypothetical protein